MIISASRRTDIPSFYSDWFMNRLRAGYVLTKNPMNPSQISRIALTTSNIDCIVFWTKDPAPMLDQLSTIDEMGFPYYFQFTLTPYGRELETNLCEREERISTFIKLSKRIGSHRVIWRYDPIILNKTLTMDVHLQAFRELSSQLCGYTDLCIISFVDIYQKLSKKVKEELGGSNSEEELRQLAVALHKISAEHKIELKACCEPIDLTTEGIGRSSCIDGYLIERITGKQIKKKTDKNQRSGCGCIQSVDIGVYNTCHHGCTYCYANHSEASIIKNISLHNPNADSMLGSVSSDAKIIDRK